VNGGRNLVPKDPVTVRHDGGHTRPHVVDPIDRHVADPHARHVRDGVERARRQHARAHAEIADPGLRACLSHDQDHQTQGADDHGSHGA
jgi:hypothetical protein